VSVGRRKTSAGHGTHLAPKNVELTIVDIRQQSAVLHGLETAGTIKMVGAMYNVETAKIDFL
jgi:carbonic anhydrase